MINHKLANAYVRRAALKNAGAKAERVQKKITHLESQSEYTKAYLTPLEIKAPEPPKLEQWTPGKEKRRVKSQHGPRRMFLGVSILKNGETWEVKSTHPQINSASNFKRREDARIYLRNCVDALTKGKESNG
jgi:hypothetical protein